MPWNHSVTGEQWQECDVCGFDYPLSQLHKQPNYGGVSGGMTVCNKCHDEPGHDYHLSKLTLPEEGQTQEVEG